MRIDLSQLTTSQIAGEHAAKKVDENGLGAVAAGGNEDRTSFSTDSASVGSLVSQAMNTPPVRSELVNQLKDAINSGQYNLDPHGIAASILNERA